MREPKMKKNLWPRYHWILSSTWFSIKFCSFSIFQSNKDLKLKCSRCEPGGSASKEFPCNTGDVRNVSSIPGSGRSPGKRNGNPLQYSCLENPMDRGAWWAPVRGFKESDTTEQLSTHVSVGLRNKICWTFFTTCKITSLIQSCVLVD